MRLSRLLSFAVALLVGLLGSFLAFGAEPLTLTLYFLLFGADGDEGAFAALTVSLIAMVGMFFMRYDLVVVGQLVPPYHGMGLVDYPEFYSYSPTLHEQLVVVGGAAFCGLFFLLGERFFRGHLVDSH